jgi:uncharacterized protein YjdB
VRKKNFIREKNYFHTYENLPAHVRKFTSIRKEKYKNNNEEITVGIKNNNLILNSLNINVIMKKFRMLATVLAIAVFAVELVSCGKNEEPQVEVTSVTVTPTTLALKAGEKQTLTVTVEPKDAANKTITWSSSAPVIAEVNASTGEVTAKAVGSATITAATANGKKATCAVTVTENVVEVTSVTVSAATLALKTGEKDTLRATVLPNDATNKTVTWSSSAPEIAEVNASNGAVAAKAAGSATITATTANNKTATCAVTVTENVVEVTSVTVSPATLALKAGEKQTLTATVAPEDATDKTVTWSSSAPEIAEVNASTGEVTAKAAGSATITTTTANGKTATCAVTVSVVEVTSVTVSPATLALKAGEKQTLTATVAPEDATDKTVTWSSSAPEIAEVNASTCEVTAKAAGSATITATANGKTATCAVTVTENEVNGLVGSWSFENLSNPKTPATLEGVPLVAVGDGFSSVEGGVKVSGETGTYYRAIHGIQPAAGETRVKEYTLMFDYKLFSISAQGNGGAWNALYQTAVNNDADTHTSCGSQGSAKEADMWIDIPNGKIGVAGYYTDSNSIPKETTDFHRLVLAYKHPVLNFYLDGQLIGSSTYTGGNYCISDRLPLHPDGVALFASGDAYRYNDIVVKKVSIWHKQLTQSEVTALGSVGN